MGYPTSIAIAQTWEKCKECPYCEQCHAGGFTERPDDAWCRQWEKRQRGE